MRDLQSEFTAAHDRLILNALSYAALMLSSLLNFIYLFLSVSSHSFAGYITRGCSQPEEVDLTLKLLVSAAPVALIIIGLSILYSYPIDEEKRQCNRKLLQEQR